MLHSIHHLSRRLPRRNASITSSSWCRHLSTSSSSSTSTVNTPSLYMWGTDTKGSLLKPQDRQDEAFLDFPTEINNWRQLLNITDNTTTSITSIVCGPTDTAFFLSNQKVLVCGENKQGQLGLGHKEAVKQPIQLTLPTTDDNDTTTSIQQVALGNTFSAILDTNGDLYTCGFGGSAFSGLGALGHGNGETYLEPKLVQSLIEDGCHVDQVQVGESHLTVLTTEGEVLCSGAGSYGRLGNLDTVDQLYLEPVELLSKEGIIQIAGGKSFTLALNHEGVVYGWGRNHKGQLGTGLGLAVDIYAMAAVPEPIEADELVGRKVTKIAAGQSHAAAITQGGELFWWGSSLYLEPVRVNDLLHTQVVDVVCGQDYTLALDKDGKLYSFGTGKTGVLGQGRVKQLNQATLMEAFEDDSKITHVSAGWKHAACLVSTTQK